MKPSVFVNFSRHAVFRLKQRMYNLKANYIARKIASGQWIELFSENDESVLLLWLEKLDAAFIVPVVVEKSICLVKTIYRASLSFIHSSGWRVLPEHIEAVKSLSTSSFERNFQCQNDSKYRIAVRWGKVNQETCSMDWHYARILRITRSEFDTFSGNFIQFLASRSEVADFFENNEFPQFSRVEIFLEKKKKRSGGTIIQTHVVTECA